MPARMLVNDMRIVLPPLCACFLAVWPARVPARQFLSVTYLRRRPSSPPFRIFRGSPQAWPHFLNLVLPILAPRQGLFNRFRVTAGPQDTHIHRFFLAFLGVCTPFFSL